MTVVSRNRLWNCKNEFQGTDIKVLCICSAGLLRSPTTARWLSRNFKNVNPRAVGTSEDYALIPMDEVHLRWADVILCMDDWNMMYLEAALKSARLEREVHCLNIPDDFGFGNPGLETIVSHNIDQLLETLHAAGAETKLLNLERF